MIKFLLYLAKIQLTLPRGKKTIKGRTIKYRTTTDTSPLGTLLIAKTPVSYIQIMPLRCRNYPSTSCHLYNWAIQTQGDICSACDCIPWFLTKGLQKLNLFIGSSSMNVNLLSFNPFLLLPIEWLYVNLPLISNFTCTHARSILRQLIVKSSSYFEFSLHPRSINPSTVDCQIFLSFRILLALTNGLFPSTPDQLSINLVFFCKKYSSCFDISFHSPLITPIHP